MTNKSHEIKWDHQTISAFWDRMSTDKGSADQYFSRQKGKAVLRLVKRHIEVVGQVVDLGCGPGYFIEHLVNEGIACSGADVSEDSVQELNSRLSKHSLFQCGTVNRGLQDVPFPSASIDVCFFLEAVEHLLPEDRKAYLENIVNALAPEGRLVLTVPYSENLDYAKIICPACGCRFHRVQHLDSFSSSSLRGLMDSYDMETVLCRPVILLPDWKIYLAALKEDIRAKKVTLHYCPECDHGFTGGKSFWRRIYDKLKVLKVFHLVYIGRKPSI